ncbi:hypothetical protein ACJIZ3_009490 [Penstemon smallii]|uniref:Uncharacterized protein n=1 Tax=Penstemon smallii TaxID=265156 RepID=A0ABD3TCN7_9LAMI
MDSESRVHIQSSPEPRSESKGLAGQKRCIVEMEETSENSHKRVKMRDLESVFRSEKAGHGAKHANADSGSKPLDLNVNIEESNKPLDLNLTAGDSSSPFNDPFYPYKNYEHLNSRDDFECGSSVGPLDEKDSMQVWKGLKRNNYMSTPSGSVPMIIPKPRGRKKNNNDLMKKKLELAKKEDADRFARFAAPSGLLHELNPGIINHVRNSKHVHSIIEAIVRSNQTENRNSGVKQNNQIKNGKQEDTGDGDSKSHMENEKDGLALKVPSSIKASSENASSFSNEESANLTNANSLSVKGANVASQWLELLNQDIRGRLAALRRSKKRVRTVIITELPLLISREFPSNFDKAKVDQHSVRWSTLFGQMDNALAEEETRLESWLNQVKDMQLQCERGLFNNRLLHASLQIGSIGNDARGLEVDNSEKDLAIRAAAASIYSTCNYMLSMEKTYHVANNYS